VTLILVTGSRNWTDKHLLADALHDLADTATDAPGKQRAIMHGDCSRGADRIARDLARSWDWIVLDRPADWRHHPRGLAGYIRNGDMVAECQDYAARGSIIRVAAFTMPCPNQPCRSRLCTGWSHGASHCGQLAEEASLTGWWVRPDGTRDPLGDCVSPPTGPITGP
jgi:hypothetical protein